MSGAASRGRPTGAPSWRSCWSSWRRRAADRLPRPDLAPRPVRTAGPAAGPALALLELVARALDVMGPRLRLLHRLDPADPFVAGERGDVLPLGERGVVGDLHLAQLGRDLMNDTVADRPGSHESGRLDPYKLTAAYRIMPALWRPSSARRS